MHTAPGWLAGEDGQNLSLAFTAYTEEELHSGCVAVHTGKEIT